VSILSIIWSLIVGFVVGLIARAVLPGAQSMGFFMTALLGILGSFAGGFFGGRLSPPPANAKFHPAGFLMSIVGAVVVLALWGLISR
jgi:uncharacterized membrane protein YeaQ/YmgE (transglycosylase-associated protein family)